MPKIKLNCSECDAEYTLTSENVDALQFCPFCGEVNALPFDDIDVDEMFDDGDADERNEEFD